MQKHFKNLVAVAAAVVAIPAFATINSTNTTADNTELVMLAWSATANASYVQDLGLTFGTFLANGSASGGYSFSAAVTSNLTGHTNLSGASDLQWAVVGFDMGDTYTQGAGGLRLLSTANAAATAGGSLPTKIMDDLQNGMSAWDGFIKSTNFLPTHSTQANGSNYAVKTDGVTYLLDPSNPQDNLRNNLAFSYGNAVGTSSTFWLQQASDDTVNNFDSSIAPAVSKFGNSAGAGVWSFNGQTLSYNLAAVPAPVPEPTSVALMLAGLGAVGALARRRKSA